MSNLTLPFSNSKQKNSINSYYERTWGLTDIQKQIAAKLVMMQKKYGVCYMDVHTFAEQLGCAKRTVALAVQRFKKRGFLITVHRKNQSAIRFFKTSYKKTAQYYKDEFNKISNDALYLSQNDVKYKNKTAFEVIEIFDGDEKSLSKLVPNQGLHTYIYERDNINKLILYSIPNGSRIRSRKKIKKRTVCLDEKIENNYYAKDRNSKELKNKLIKRSQIKYLTKLCEKSYDREHMKSLLLNAIMVYDSENKTIIFTGKSLYHEHRLRNQFQDDAFLIPFRIIRKFNHLSIGPIKEEDKERYEFNYKLPPPVEEQLAKYDRFGKGLYTKKNPKIEKKLIRQEKKPWNHSTNDEIILTTDEKEEGLRCLQQAIKISRGGQNE